MLIVDIRPFNLATDALSNVLVARFLVLWWLVGTLVITSKGPFLSAQNGYFASWSCVALSIAYAKQANA